MKCICGNRTTSKPISLEIADADHYSGRTKLSAKSLVLCRPCRVRLGLLIGDFVAEKERRLVRHAALTARQLEVLLEIERGLKEQRPRSFRELCEALGITSPNGLVCHLDALEKKGFIERDDSKSRSIRVLK